MKGFAQHARGSEQVVSRQIQPPDPRATALLALRPALSPRLVHESGSVSTPRRSCVCRFRQAGQREVERVTQAATRWLLIAPIGLLGPCLPASTCRIFARAKIQ